MVSVVKGINEPRYPSFKGIMAAKSKPVTDYTWPIWVSSRAVGAGATTEGRRLRPPAPAAGGPAGQGAGGRQRPRSS